MEVSLHQLLQEAINLHRAGELLLAKSVYENILNLKPNHPDANHNLGVLMVTNGEYEQSIKFFQAALDENPSITQFWISYIETLIQVNSLELASTALVMGEQQCNSDPTFEKLRHRLNETGHQSPDQNYDQIKGNPISSRLEPTKKDLQALLALFKTGNFQLVLDKVQYYLQSFPDSASLFNIKGAAHAELKQTDLAISSYKSVVKIQPNLAEAHFNLGSILHEKLQFEEAIFAYKTALKFKPELYAAYFNLGNIYKDIDKIDAAIDCYHSVIRLSPNHAEALFAMGVVLSTKGDFDSSIEFYKQAVRFNPKNFKAYFNMGVALFDNGYLEESIKNYQLCIQINPNFPEALNNLANAFKAKNEIPAAKKYYKQAINMNPDFAEAYLNLGTILEDNGELSAALEIYSRLIAQDPSNHESYRKLGNLLKNRGKYAAAIDSFNRALELNPNDASTYYGLADVLSSRGELEKSSRCYEKSIKLSKDPLQVKKAESFLLKTLYFLGDEYRFKSHLNKLISLGESNPVIGSFAGRAEAKFGIKISNSYCNKPIHYVVEKSLLHSCDFEETFVMGAKKILQSGNIQERNQPLLSNGKQTAGDLFSSNNSFVKNATKIIDQEICKYRHTFKDSTEGLITQWPSSYKISGWLVSYKNGGSIRPHMHENGWISGSIYINVPPGLKNDAGSLVVCVEDPQYTTDADDKSNKIINVETGSLCLFPASLLHYTIPFEAKEDRIVLAFDVLPQ